MMTAFQPKYHRWLLTLGFCSAGMIVAVTGIEWAVGYWELALSYLATAILILFVLWSLVPRSYELWPDRLLIVSGWPFRVNVPFDTVTEVYPPGAKKGSISSENELSQPSPAVVKIKRSRGREVVLSPCDHSGFLEQVQVSLAEYNSRSTSLDQR